MGKKSNMIGNKVGVTTIISQTLGWDKDILLNWYAELYGKGVNVPTYVEQTQIAGDLFHKMIDDYLLKEEITLSEEEEQQLNNLDFNLFVKINYAITLIPNIVKQYDLNLIEAEKVIISKDEDFFGTLDLLCYSGNKDNIYLVDIKTSKYVSPEYYIQLAAYKKLLRQENIYPIKTYLLKIDKESFEPVMIEMEEEKLEKGEEVFNMLLKLYNYKKFFNFKDLNKEEKC